MIYQLKIQIQGITKPPVWRKILIPSDASFESLHNVIQEAFDWENYHLFQFSKKPYDQGWCITDERNKDPFAMAEDLQAKDIAIQDYLNPLCPKITYTYDFGDDWIHQITLENPDVKDVEDPEHAHCIDGKGVPALEDCGGVYGFMELREGMRAKPAKSKEILTLEDGTKAMRWVGGQYLKLDKDGKPDFSKIDVTAIDSLVSSIPLTIIKAKKKAASKKTRGGKINTEDRDEFKVALMDIFRQVYGDKIIDRFEKEFGDDLNNKLDEVFGKKPRKKK